MSTFDMDLKFNKIIQLANIFKTENINEKGIYHIQRNFKALSDDDLKLIVAHDIHNLFNNFSEGEITYSSYLKTESVKVLSLTLRLNTQAIVKYVLTSNTHLENRLRLNFSVAKRVFEYDDERKYLNTSLHQPFTTTLEHNDETRSVLKMIEEAYHD